MKKKIVAILSILMSGLMLLLSGCRVKIYEDMDFYYGIDTEDPSIWLHGLTETGKGKSIIIVPKEIDGIEVRFLTHTKWVRGSSLLESENLEAIYIQNSLCIMNSEAFQGCPNLKKIIFLDTEKWITMGAKFYAADQPDLHYYTSSYGLDEYISEYNYSEEKLSKGLYIELTFDWKLANVSYMQNYEGAENQGYYWIDNFEYGTTIDYIPENPLREGYVFGGWFKEPEGINIWNFEKDKLPELVLNEDGAELYQETRLYAKWYKK